MSICPSCDKKNPDEAKHCMYCGEPIYHQPSKSDNSIPGFIPDKRLKDWFKFLHRWTGYAKMMNESFENTKSLMAKIPNTKPSTENQYGIIIPIQNKDWSISSINGIFNGALATFNTRLIVYDFSQQKSYSISYSALTGVERQKETITLKCKNPPDIRMQFKTAYGKQNAWMWFNAILGVAGSLSSDSGDRAISHINSRDAVESSSSEIKVIDAYLDTIYNFFVEAMNGEDAER